MGNECSNHFCTEQSPKTEKKNWMSTLSDSTPIYLMTIPGTHNSCALYGTFLAQCQSWSIPNQLNAGIRYFDLRLRLNENKLQLQHGPIEQKIEFSEVIKFFSEFLKENQSEFIIMAIQEEYKPIKKGKSFEELFNDKIINYKNQIINFRFNDEINFTLGELRGKILFIKLFEGKIHRRRGIQVQNEWVCNYKSNIVDKKRKVKRFFNKAIHFINQKNLFINYLSASSDYLLLSPGEIAKNINKEVFKFKGRLGIILCVFPGENLISYLIEQNLNIEKFLIKDNLFVTNNSCVTIKNFNTGKFLSIDNNNKLFCCKNPYNFLLAKKSYQSEDEMLVTNDEIILIGNCDFNFVIIKDNNFYNMDAFNPFISNSDIIKLITIENRNCVICSDYQYKEKNNKIQKVEIKENGNDNSQNWIINIEN